MFVTCPDCGKERWIKLSDVTKRVNSKSEETADLDWNAGTGSYRCVQCTRSKNLTTFHEKTKTRHGKKFYVDQGHRLITGLTPEQRAENLAAAQEANRSRVRTEAERRNIGKGHIIPNPRGGKFGICRLCLLIVYARGQTKRQSAIASALTDGARQPRDLMPIHGDQEGAFLTWRTHSLCVSGTSCAARISASGIRGKVPGWLPSTT